MFIYSAQFKNNAQRERTPAKLVYLHKSTTGQHRPKGNTWVYRNQWAESWTSLVLQPRVKSFLLQIKFFSFKAQTDWIPAWHFFLLIFSSSFASVNFLLIFLRCTDRQCSDGCRWMLPHPVCSPPLCTAAMTSERFWGFFFSLFFWQRDASTGLTSVKRDKLQHISGLFKVRQETRAPARPPACTATLILMSFQEIA